MSNTWFVETEREMTTMTKATIEDIIQALFIGIIAAVPAFKLGVEVGVSPDGAGCFSVLIFMIFYKMERIERTLWRVLMK